MPSKGDFLLKQHKSYYCNHIFISNPVSIMKNKTSNLWLVLQYFSMPNKEKKGLYTTMHQQLKIPLVGFRVYWCKWQLIRSLKISQCSCTLKLIPPESWEKQNFSCWLWRIIIMLWEQMSPKKLSLKVKD